MSPQDICPLLSVRIVRKAFAHNLAPVLENLAFEVPKESFVSILGESGCGKSTLLRMIAGLDRNYDGEIFWHAKGKVAGSDTTGFVFQEPRLLGWKTVEQNIEFGLCPSLKPSEKQQKIDQALDLVGLTLYRKLWPSQLSGGMSKRASLARALIGSPDLLLLDEPFSGLDFVSKVKLWKELEIIHQTQALTTVMVTHDLEEALYLSDIVLFLSDRPTTLKHRSIISITRPRSNFIAKVRSERNDLLKSLMLEPDGKEGPHLQANPR